MPGGKVRLYREATSTPQVIWTRLKLLGMNEKKLCLYQWGTQKLQEVRKNYITRLESSSSKLTGVKLLLSNSSPSSIVQPKSDKELNLFSPCHKNNNKNNKNKNKNHTKILQKERY